MKKTVCLAISSLLTAALFTGCTAKKEEYTAGSYASDEKVTAVSIDVRDRAIEVMLSEDSKVHIDYFESSKKQYDITVSDDGTLTMTAADSKEWSDYIGGKAPSEARRITLYVPDEALGSLSISNTNEDIVLAPLSIGDVSLNSNGGNISFEKLNAENSVELNVKNGNIKGTIVGSYDDYSISCSIKKGETNIPEKKDGGAKILTASANNGDIDINFVE